MFFTLQLPICDARQFVAAETGRLARPDWTLPAPDDDFVRDFGVIRRRRRGGVAAWPGDEHFCDARSGLRLDPSCSRLVTLSDSGAVLTPDCVARRLFHDNEALARLEVSLRYRFRERAPLPESDIEELVRSFARIPVRASHSPSSISLVNAGRSVARAFLAASTRQSTLQQQDTPAWWVTGLPSVVVVEHFEGVLDHAQLRRVQLENRAFEHVDLFRRVFFIEGRNVTTWFVVQAFHAHNRAFRELRIAILRLHAEKECLREVLRLLRLGVLRPVRGTPSSERLQGYLLRASRFLNQRRRYGKPLGSSAPVQELFDRTLDPGEVESLRQALRDIRPNVARRVIQDAQRKRSNEDSTTKRHIVVLVHGIRTGAAWAEMVKAILESSPALRVEVVRYGYYDLMRFWLPPLRRYAVARLVRSLRLLREQSPDAKISVLAHSFGTYCLAKALEEEADIRVHRIVLSGAIVAADYRWDKALLQIDGAIINDCGIKDYLPVAAYLLAPGYGAIGWTGAGHPVRDRFHGFGHSGFFSRDFVGTYWLPFMSEGKVVQSAMELNRPALQAALLMLTSPVTKLVLWLGLMTAIAFLSWCRWAR